MSGEPGSGGPTLADALHAYSFDLAQVDDLARSLIEELGALHARGDVHGALHPATVRLDLQQGAPRPILEARGGAGPRIPAPEELAGDTPSASSDLFALAAVLFELCTGRPAGAADDRAGLARRVLEGEQPSPRALVPDLPERMERAITQALRADPERRPRSAAALLSTWEGRGEGEGTGRVAPARAWDDRSIAILRALGDSPPGPWRPPSAPPPAPPAWTRIARVDAPAATALLVLVGVWLLLALAAAVGRVPADPAAFVEFSRTDPWPALLTVMGTLGGGGVLVWRLARIRSVFRRGRRVRGTVDDVFFHRGRGRVRYRYVVDGRRLTSWAPVRATAEARALERGDELEVVVDPERPGVAYLPRLYS